MVSSLLEECGSEDESATTTNTLAEALIAKLSPQKPKNKRAKFPPTSTFSLFYDVVILQTSTKICALAKYLA